MASDIAIIAVPERAAATSSTTVDVSITGLQVAADIGVYAHEHGRAQPLVVDIVVRIDTPMSDDVQQTVDYQRLADDAHALALGRIALIETYAIRLAERCIAHPGARSVEVRVAKPGALRGGLAGTRVVLGGPIP